MNNFTFYNPTKILFGEGTIPKIGEELSNRDHKKILLLYGKGSIKRNGVYDTVINSLKENNIEFVELDGVKPNPVLSKVHEAVVLCKEHSLEAILAVGGGSVIDSAKAIGAGALYDGDIWDAFEGKIRVKESLPIFTILTISATASEMNTNSVVTKEDEDKKWPMLTGPCSYPVVSIMDPKVQAELPVSQTINGAVDAISHIMEFYFDGSPNTDIQDEFSEGMIRTVIKHSKILLTDPTNYESRSQLMWVATLALNGVISSGTTGGDWSSHMLEHSLSAFYDVAHGAGLAIMFPAWMKYVHENNISKFAQFGERVFGLNEGTDDVKAVNAIYAIESFFRKLAHLHV